jgi:signal transduction histidine kinase
MKPNQHEKGVREPGYHQAEVRRFPLLRYFALTSLLAFVGLSAALYWLERTEEDYFRQVQTEQALFFADSQRDLMRRQEADAHQNLIAVHEVAHVNLARVLANILWEPGIAPLASAVQALPIMTCPSADAPHQDIKACETANGRRVMALPGFAKLDTSAYETMRQTTVFKIKVFDPKGLTIYSSEHSQIGERKSDNLGWQAAASGRPASELTHRDRFSAFEGIVEGRDLISSYIPVWSASRSEVVGVFEIYSDVTPLLEQIREASARMRERIAANQRQVQEAASEHQKRVGDAADRVVLTMGGLLLLTYAILWAVMNVAQRLIDRQAQAQMQATQREEAWHREKMAALATMADGVSHAVGNPIAAIAGAAEAILAAKKSRRCEACNPELILQQTDRIASMARDMVNFAGAQGTRPEFSNVNATIHALCEFLAFDRRLRGRHIEFRPDEDLPACRLVPDHFNEAMMNLLLCTLSDEPSPRSGDSVLVVTTSRMDGRIAIRVDFGQEWSHHSADRLGAVERKVASMHGQIELFDTGVEVTLPVTE